MDPGKEGKRSAANLMATDGARGACAKFAYGGEEGSERESEQVVEWAGAGGHHYFALNHHHHHRRDREKPQSQST